MAIRLTLNNNNNNHNHHANVTIIIIIEYFENIQNSLCILPQTSQPLFEVETPTVPLSQMTEPSREAIICQSHIDAGR